MAFRKGESGNPEGRPKGAKNRATHELRQWIGDFLTEKFPELKQGFEQLEPYQQWSIVEKLLQYSVPKMQSVSVEAMVEAETRALADLMVKAPEQAVDLLLKKLRESDENNE